jgi:hypothetical protein
MTRLQSRTGKGMKKFLVWSFQFSGAGRSGEHWGGCEKEQPKVGPKGEEVGTNESKDTESTE